MFTNDELIEFPGLKFEKAVYSKGKNICTLSFLYNPALFELNDENKAKLNNLMTNLIGKFVKIILTFSKCVVNNDIVANYCFLTLTNNFPALSKNLLPSDIVVQCKGIDCDVKISLTPSIYDYATEANRTDDVVKKLSENFVANFFVSFEKKAAEELTTTIADNIEFQNSIQSVNLQSMFQLEDIEDIIGKNDYNVAIDFTTITQPINDIVICGTIKYINKRFFNKTINKNGNSTTIEKCYFNFNISNNGNSIYCTIFPSDKDIAKLDALAAGDAIAMKGKMKLFQEKLSFTADSLCKCKFTECKPKVEYKKVNEKYHTIFPSPYQDVEQIDLFSITNEKPVALTGEYVVFDFETTGLEASKNEIIEIGAVKVKDGVIVETFACFVKPSEPIPVEITDITSITNEMVENAPAINLILPDFYKFCNDATLVAYNIDFDFKFLKSASEKLLYNFDNKQIDAYALARNKIKSLKNYKLISVAEHFGIDLENAHRAVYDAIATAKVFLKMMQM